MRLFVISITTLIGWLLMACSSMTAPSANTPSPIATQPPTVVPRPTPTIEPLPAGALAIYHKRGCFQGLDETLVIHSDGALAFTDTRGATQQAHIKAERLTVLQGLLAQPEFAQLQPLYQAMGADLCVYTITARRNGQAFSVTTMDGAESPELLRQVLKETERLRGQADGWR